MTTTFIVGYIVLAVILVGLVNVLVLKSRKSVRTKLRTTRKMKNLKVKVIHLNLKSVT